MSLFGGWSDFLQACLLGLLLFVYAVFEWRGGGR